MSRRVNFTLTPEQLAEIEQAINHSEFPEVRQRAIAIRLLHLGQHPEQVADAVMVKANTVWTWHRRWRQGGISGLQDQPKSGRPRKATPEYVTTLEATLKQSPADVGLDASLWTINRLRLYLAEQTGIRLSYSRFRSLLSKLGYRWKQPKHDLGDLQDKTAQQVAGEILDWLKKTPRSIPSRPSTSSLWTKRR
jgi:transposase